jgi:muramoyltetrapeptide carboxypeptidase
MATTRPRTLGIVAPAGHLPDVGVIDRVARFFSAQGWRVEAGDSAFSREERFAGSDALRLADLQRFATDPSVDVVLCARGGYGLSRLLTQIDFASIRSRGAVLCGFSDFTAFNLAYLSAGGVSFSGPSAADFGAEPPDAYTIEHFFGVLSGPRHSVELDLDGPAADISGRLWGGNLAMVAALTGTRFMPRVRGGLLFLEDVNEPAYRLERMFYQLAHAGILQRQAAIVLGDFSPVPVLPNDNGFGLQSVIGRLRELADVPVYTGLPVGHVPRKLTLPVGGRARLTVRRSGRAVLELSRYPFLA